MLFELERSREMGKLVAVVEELFSQQMFPSVETLAFGSVISSCQNGKYMSIDEVHRDMACRYENYPEENAPLA
jgi:hypothetical protein